MKIINELKSFSEHFNDWNKVIQDYHKVFSENNDSDDQNKLMDIVVELHNIFEIILTYFTRHGEFKDSWNFPARLNLFPLCQYATVGSEKLELEFNFGIDDYQNFFLNTDLVYPFNIKYMNDIFWSHFIELDSLGKFEFLENSLVTSDTAQKAFKNFKNSNSNIFRLIRNYILFEIYEGGCADYGSLEIKWPLSTPWDKIINNGSLGFKHLYKINYMLYKNEYLRIKGKYKKKSKLKPEVT